MFFFSFIIYTRYCFNFRFSAPVVLVPNKVPPLVEAQVSLDSSFQVISLNCEQDYPDGSWLGDETQIESKVRVPITPGYSITQFWN